MKDKRFYEGQILKCVEGFIVGDNCIDIVVVMENGQMDGVPWALVTHGDGSQKKLNLALYHYVELVEDSPNDKE